VWAGVGVGQRNEVACHDVDLIAMTHPDLCFARHTGEEIICFLTRIDRAMRAAELPDLVALHAAAERLRHELHSVADAEHGDAEIEDARIALRRALGVNAGRAAGEDESDGRNLAHASGSDVVPNDFGVHVLLAHTAGNELSVLRAEIENEDALGSEIRCARCGQICSRCNAFIRCEEKHCWSSQQWHPRG
jgi:hypothetical protein